MTIADTLLPDFDTEFAATRRVLARVPDASADWKPHPKSFSLSQLAMHLANFGRWGSLTMIADELDLARPDMAPAHREPFTGTAALLETFDRQAGEFRAQLASADDDAMRAMWTLKHGERVGFTMPRMSVLRSTVLHHMIHHRGQLTVYLRLLDVPLPDVYGPTADTLQT